MLGFRVGIRSQRMTKERSATRALCFFLGIRAYGTTACNSVLAHPFKGIVVHSGMSVCPFRGSIFSYPATIR